MRDIRYIYRVPQATLPGIMEQSGGQSPFEARAFRELLLVASEIAGGEFVIN